MIFAIFLISYLIGSIPSGKIIANSYDIKIEKEGSGNIGATNVARTVGKKAGILTLALDVAKGFTAVFLAKMLGLDFEMQAISGLCAVCGHCFSIPGLLKGGKGVATALGVLLATSAIIALSAVLIFSVFFYTTRIVSISSLAASLTVLCIGIYSNYSYYGLTLSLMALLTITKHIPNIRRLLEGKEGKFR